jgi:hypothetical protein
MINFEPGEEPTTDPAKIREWAEAGRDLAVMLNEMPADGPVHPCHQHIYPDAHLVTVCPTTGRRLESYPLYEGDERATAVKAAEIARTWGCTYMILMGPIEEEVTDA